MPRASNDNDIPLELSVEGWEHLLESRKARLIRLLDLNAPEIIIENEQELIAKAEAGLKAARKSDDQ